MQQGKTIVIFKISHVTQKCFAESEFPRRLFDPLSLQLKFLSLTTIIRWKRTKKLRLGGLLDHCTTVQLVITPKFKLHNEQYYEVYRLIYDMALSHKDWELPNSRIWLAEIDIDRGLDFPI